MRILLAEDKRPLAKALVKIFKKINCSADAVYDGEDALHYLESGNYDVAVLDIMMPKLDGIGVLKKLRAAGNAIPVLFLTAKSEVDDKVQGLDSGANYYLTKPFDTIELLATLRGNDQAVQKLISILMDNALKYSPAGGKISLYFGRQTKALTLTVANPSTPELSREDLDHIFDRFYRTDRSRNSKTGGHGIGLSIAKAIVTAHGGRIQADMPTGNLFQITVSFPL